MDGRILVATDGTGGSLGALRVAAALAEREGRPPLVVSVVEPIVLEGSVLYAVPGEALALAVEPEAEVRGLVRAQLATLGPAAAGWETEVAVGRAGPTIARLAEERGAGVIVMGLGRHSRRERFLGGETALDVVRVARVPVLAVPPEAEGLPRRGVVAADFSEYSRDAARTLAEVAAEGAELRLAHVVWSLRGEDEADEWHATYLAGVRARLEEMAGELRALRPSARVELEVLEGSPVREVLGLAERAGADIVAAGSHGYGFFTRLVMGSVSAHLLRGAERAVLIAPPRAPSTELSQARAGRAAAPAEPAGAV